MPNTHSSVNVAAIANSFLEKAGRLSLKNYDNDIQLIKEFAAEAREELCGVDIEQSGLDAKTLTVMRALAAGKQEDERIIGLALMAHNAARIGGNLAAQAALFVHLSGPAGFVLAHESDASWEKLSPEVRLAMADWAGNIFGGALMQEAVKDAVLSLKTEKIAGVVAYVVSGRMEGDVAYWESMEPMPGRGRPSLAEYLREAIGFSCVDAVVNIDPKIVGGQRRVSIEMRIGDPSSNNKLAPQKRPDRVVITPNGRGGVERLTVVLAFSGSDSSGQYYGDYVEGFDALTASDSGSPFANVPVYYVYMNAGNFIASGQNSGTGVRLSQALDGAPLEERQDLATLALLSTPLQWGQKKTFMDFFRFNPLVLGTSTLRWFHFVEQLASSEQTPDQKRREALLWTIDRFSSALKAVDFATNSADYLEGGFLQQANSAIEKIALLFDTLPLIGGDVLTKKDYDDAVCGLARQSLSLTKKLTNSISGRNLSSLNKLQKIASSQLEEFGHALFLSGHASQTEAPKHKDILVESNIQDDRMLWAFHPVDTKTGTRVKEISSCFRVSDIVVQTRLLQRKKDINKLLSVYRERNPNGKERTKEAYRQTVERVAATIANDDIWSEVVRGNPTPSVLEKNGFCELSPEAQDSRWAELRTDGGQKLKANRFEDRLTERELKFLKTRQADIAAITIASRAASSKPTDEVRWMNLTTLLTRLALVLSPLAWNLLLPEPDGKKSPISAEFFNKYNSDLLSKSHPEQDSMLAVILKTKSRMTGEAKRKIAAALDHQDGPDKPKRRPL
jgi:hypothetical protein